MLCAPGIALVAEAFALIDAFDGDCCVFITVANICRMVLLLPHSRELYEWCLREGYGDAALIAKWKKQGYERLCCLSCIQPKEHKFGGTCVCRVPRAEREGATAKQLECVHCGT